MRVQCSRDGLCVLAKHASCAAARPPSPQELCGIHIQADRARSSLTLTATDVNVSIRTSMCAEVERSGSAVVSARLLPKLLACLPEETAALELPDNGRLSIRSGAAAYALDVLPGERYPMPELPYPEDTAAVTGLRALTRHTVFAASSQPDAPLMGCVKLILDQTGLKGMSTNGFCITEAMGDDACQGRSELLIPARSLSVLAALSQDSDVYEMGLAGKNVVFWNGTMLFSARLVEGAFPDVSAVLKRFQGRYSVIVEAGALCAALSSVTAVLGDRPGQAGLSCQEGALTVSAQSACGMSSLPVKAIVRNGPDRVFYYEPAFLLAYLKQCGGDVTLEFDENGILVVCHRKTRYLQCPMRPPREAAKGTKKAA